MGWLPLDQKLGWATAARIHWAEHTAIIRVVIAAAAPVVVKPLALAPLAFARGHTLVVVDPLADETLGAGARALVGREDEQLGR